MNYVCIIGILVEIGKAYLVIKTDDEIIKVFFDEFDASTLSINEPIKIEGKITNVGFPFEVVKVEKIYTLQETIS